MLKGGGLLFFASISGFLANFVFSTSLDHEHFGQIFTYFTVVSIVGLILPLGSNSYYLTDRESYVRYAALIQTIPFLLASLLAFIFFIFRPSLQSAAFGSLLIATTASVQGILDGQIKLNSLQAAIFQSVPSLIKFGVALVLLIFLSSGAGEKRHMDNIFLWALLGFSLVGVFLIRKSIPGEFFLRGWRGFWRGISIPSLRELGAFWVSTVFGIIFSLGITPLTAKLHGYLFSAYLGVYFIFWSTSNIAITAAINNHYWPKASALKGNYLELRRVRRTSFLVTCVLSSATLLGTIIVAQFWAKDIWPNFTDLRSFLSVAALALFARTFSAWVGMMFLNFDGLIRYKAIVQFFGITAMVFAVANVDQMTASKLGAILVSVESFGLMGYIFLAGSDILRKKKAIQSKGS